MGRTKTELFKSLDSQQNSMTAEGVVIQLRDMIHRGELLSGDRLPPERDLAKMLGVSRPTLRAGIRSLTTVGILQSRQGAGTFVAERDESPTLDS
ncbi:MAG TPA: GntR family transcriptional regulator, partial [Pyrinomonadaceae bacterium]|nr:GntR family transcriptional regulator [Pyrinomonadaceae bacterium]